MNNPANNFFCSQINNENGVLDTTGTFGTRNANALTGTNVSAGRQGYDITAVDLTGKLASEQTSAYIRFTSTGDLYVPNALALQIDNGADPNLSVVKTADKSTAVKGDLIKYTSVVLNTGSLPLSNVIFTDDIPAGTAFVENSVTVDGISVPGVSPASGFPLSNMIPNQAIVVTFQVQVL